MNFVLRLCAVLVIAVVTARAQVPAGSNPAPPAPPPAAAEPAGDAPSPAAAVPDQDESLVDMLRKGGKTIYFLVALSVVMFALIAFYLLTVRRGAVVSDHFMRLADSLIRKQDYLGLLAVCNRRNECIATITQKALDFATKNPTATFDEVRDVTESEGQRQATMLNQRITYLADVGAVAPMVGLLGTVIGIVSQFQDISKKDMLAAQMEFSGGTAIALVNTCAGLAIAIPSLVVYSIYRGRVISLIS
jgi:biopolymer transport protein ExbB